MNGKRWGALGIASFLFIFSLFTSFIPEREQPEDNLSTFLNEFGEGFSETVIEEGTGMTTKKIVVLNVDGVIQDTGEDALFAEGYHHREFLAMLDEAAEDDNVKGILLRVNSPGGGVMESAEIHEKIVEIKEEYNKAVYVSMGSLAASGGYYISAPATKIVAAPETLTGSLGVIMQSINFSEFANELGVKFETIKSGKYKDIMSSSREMTEDERKILQELVDESYEGFVDVIANGRNMTEDEVKKIADGRIYSGSQAKELNLVDELGFFDDALITMKEDLDLKNAKVVEYESSMGLNSLFKMSATKIFSGEFELISMYKMATNPNTSRLMYLYTE
ncbi:signal peptide peptidase SppA [Bacillus carboniphilus]|uniref:Signal peptide peptidase SppA n=1 Tax=Bacillus carboniphilus TaxID=86663 RepID=A0ABY9JXT1_9BACI|nr:signal peptide peptidase SppA [Bacillus carboniphilus]WLR44186.1 signal peptide peptidase SppA [Bacillus carboniphilus]